jgi:hypothetical protein
MRMGVSTGEFGAELLTLDDPALSVGRMQHMEDGSGSVGTSISSKEERDLQGLMQSFKVGIGNVDEFMDRLDETLKALEVCLYSFYVYRSVLCAGVCVCVCVTVDSLLLILILRYFKVCSSWFSCLALFVYDRGTPERRTLLFA